ncbi:MAG TPA: TldD/PmbA family protein, partial [Candidatus Aerophobetes bacterium]|nr:TldD/PmbA family protein [Candidatus Aerophobetes bacterium]
MEKILEIALSKAQEAEVYRVRKQVTTVKFQANRIKSIDSLFEDGVGLRVIKEGRIGFSSANNLKDARGLV